MDSFVISKNEEVVSLYLQASLEYIELHSRPDLTIQQAQQIEPNNPFLKLSFCNLYYLSAMFPTDHPPLIQILKEVKQDLDSNNEHLMLYFEITCYIAQFDYILAGEKIIQLLQKNPENIFCLRLIIDCVIKSGRIDQLFQAKKAVKAFYLKSEHYLDLYLSFYSFALLERQKYKKAELLALQSFELNMKNFWAVHALAHIYEMTQRYDQGADFLHTIRTQWTTSLISTHIGWHWGLFLLESQNPQQSLEIFQSYIKIDNPMNLADAVGLLWRAELKGIEVPFWPQLHEKLVLLGGLKSNGFYQMHIAMGWARLGKQYDWKGEQWLKGNEWWESLLGKDIYGGEVKKKVVKQLNLQKKKQSEDIAQALTLEEQENEEEENVFKGYERESNVESIIKGIQVMAVAFLRFQQSKIKEGIEKFSGVLDQINLLGGSVAQRQIFYLTYVNMLQHLGQISKANQVQTEFIDNLVQDKSK